MLSRRRKDRSKETDAVTTTSAAESTARKWSNSRSGQGKDWYCRPGTVRCFLSEAKRRKTTSMIKTQHMNNKNNTNRGVCKVVDHDSQGAGRELSNRGVPEAKVLDQECVVTK